MKIKDYLDTRSIAINLEVNNKLELLNRMLDLAYNTGKVINKEEALKEILNREAVLSTGVGKGIALPHAKTKFVKDSILSFATLKEPLDYESLDGQPVKIVCLLLGLENNVGAHLKLLSKISRLLNNDILRTELLNAKDNYDVINILSKMDD